MNDWYESFFDALAHDVWRGLVPDDHSDAEAAFLDEVLGLSRRRGWAARVLDVPSGDGRLAGRLAARGHRVTAVDLSAVAVDRLSSLGSGVAARQGDMARLDDVLATDERFDGACCMGNSFGYLDDEDTRAFVGGVAARLEAGARFVVDYPAVAECVLPGLGSHDEHRRGDVALTIDTSYEAASSTLVSAMVLQCGDEVDRRVARHRVRTCAQVVGFLTGAGLRLVDLYGGVDAGPFDVGSPTLLLVAERP